jgi:hypothetical protein
MGGDPQLTQVSRFQMIFAMFGLQNRRKADGDSVKMVESRGREDLLR